MLKNRTTLTVLGLALFALFMISVTLAYFTDSRSVTNTLGIGTDEDGNRSVLISLEEPSFAAHADSKTYLLAGDKELTAATVGNLMPGDKIYKDPIIENVGKVNVFVRVKIDPATIDIQQLIDDLGLEIESDFYATTQSDGFTYYYYGTSATDCKLLSPTDGAIPFFKIKGGTGTDQYSMEIPKTWGNSELSAFATTMGGSTFDIPIEVQAIQADNFSGGIPWEDQSDYSGTIQSVAIADR